MSHVPVINGMEHQIPSLQPLHARVKPHILMPKYVFQLNLNVNSEKSETNYAILPNLYLYPYPPI